MTVQPPSRWGGSLAQEEGEGVLSLVPPTGSSSSSLELSFPLLFLLLDVELTPCSAPHLSLLRLLLSRLYLLSPPLLLLLLLRSPLQSRLLSLLLLLFLSLLLLLPPRLCPVKPFSLLRLLLSSFLVPPLNPLWLLSPSASRLYQDSKLSFTVGTRFLSFNFSLSLSSFQFLLPPSLSLLSRSRSPLQLLQECVQTFQIKKGVKICRRRS